MNEYLGTDKQINRIKPLVSVCIPTFNHVAYIAECLDSVLMQDTDFDFEIIIGEDDSTDGTRAICIAYAEKHPDKIRLFLRDAKDKIFINGKMTGRFNWIENLRAARGEYIALLDGDDYWITSKKLQIQKDLLESNKGAVMAFSGWNDKIKSFDESKLKFKVHRKRGEFDNSVAHTSSLFFKNKIADLPQYFFEVKVGDRQLFSYILSFGYGINVTPPLSFYRRHDGGVWTRISEEQRINDRLYDLRILYNHKRISLYYFLSRSISLKYPKLEASRNIKILKKQSRDILKRFSKLFRK